MKHRVYVIRKVYFPVHYTTYYYIGSKGGAESWCDKNRDASREIYCNIEGSMWISESRIDELIAIGANVIKEGE